ncbi:MAG: hypothetical protein ILO34_01935, partial [Kiritimatiellae bacterium]|nr:hypothetical protein [Kiritimatiellia bacterium]
MDYSTMTGQTVAGFLTVAEPYPTPSTITPATFAASFFNRPEESSAYSLKLPLNAPVFWTYVNLS